MKSPPRRWTNHICDSSGNVDVTGDELSAPLLVCATMPVAEPMTSTHLQQQRTRSHIHNYFTAISIFTCRLAVAPQILVLVLVTKYLRHLPYLTYHTSTSLPYLPYLTFRVRQQNCLMLSTCSQQDFCWIQKSI